MMSNPAVLSVLVGLLAIVVTVFVMPTLNRRRTDKKGTSDARKTFQSVIRPIRAEIAHLPDDKINHSVYAAYQKSVPVVRDACHHVETDLSKLMRDRLLKDCTEYCAMQDGCRDKGGTRSDEQPLIRKNRKRFLELLDDMIDCAK